MRSMPWFLRFAIVGVTAILGGIFSITINSLWRESIEKKAKIVGHYKRSSKNPAIVAKYRFRVENKTFHGGIEYPIYGNSVTSVAAKHPVGKVINISYIPESPVRNKAFYSKSNSKSWSTIGIGVLLCIPIFLGQRLTKG